MARSRKAALPAAARVFAPEGELTIRTAAAVRDDLQRAIDEGCGVIDLSRIEAFDTAGVQLLIAARAAIATLGGRLELRGATDPVRSLVALYRLEPALELQ